MIYSLRLQQTSQFCYYCCWWCLLFSIYFNSIEFNFNIIQNMSQLQFLKDLNLVVKWLNYYLSGCLSVHPSFSLSERLSDWVCEWMSLSGFCWVRVLYIFVFNKIALSLFVPERDFHTFYFSFFTLFVS